MRSISFHIYKTQNHTWTLSYTVSGHKHKEAFLTQNDALQASYNTAARALES